MTFPILTAITGTNADLLPNILSLYVRPRHIIADVTYGKGVFWRNLTESDWKLFKFDLNPIADDITSADFRCLPLDDNSIDLLILDPPYMHGGSTVKQSINDCYKNQNTSHESVIRLYAGGLLETARVIKQQGRIIIKCQDEIESGKQRLSHCEIIDLLKLFGFIVIDIFVLVQSTIPAMREQYQKSARKNHSFAIVAEFRR